MPLWSSRGPRSLPATALCCGVPRAPQPGRGLRFGTDAFWERLLGRTVLCPPGKAGLGAMGRPCGGRLVWPTGEEVCGCAGDIPSGGPGRLPPRSGSSAGWEDRSRFWETWVEMERGVGERGGFSRYLFSSPHAWEGFSHSAGLLSSAGVEAGAPGRRKQGLLGAVAAGQVQTPGSPAPKPQGGEEAPPGAHWGGHRDV